MDIYEYAPDYAAIKARLERINIPAEEGDRSHIVKMEGLAFKLKAQTQKPLQARRPEARSGQLYNVSQLGHAQGGKLHAPSAAEGSGGMYVPKMLSLEVTTVKLINLPRELTKHNVRELVLEKGLRMMTCNLVQDKKTLESKGMAFVSFPGKEEAERAIALLDGHRIDSNIVSAEIARK